MCREGDQADHLVLPVTPYAAFQSVWNRCDELRSIHAYLSSQLTAALTPDELLRAEWVSRVSALDLYFHELIAQRMIEIFQGSRIQAAGFQKLVVSGEALMRIKAATTAGAAESAFDLEIRGQLGRLTFQHPDKIADGIRLISDIEFWNELAMLTGATLSTKSVIAKSLRQQLSAIVDRRNKIAHEGDLQLVIPRLPYAVTVADLGIVTTFINNLVLNVERLV